MKKLEFKKNVVEELSDKTMNNVKGGDVSHSCWVLATTPSCVMTSVWFGCMDKPSDNQQ